MRPGRTKNGMLRKKIVPLVWIRRWLDRYPSHSSGITAQAIRAHTSPRVLRINDEEGGLCAEAQEVH